MDESGIPTMDFHIIQPPAVLSPYVRYFWTLDIGDPACRDRDLHIFADRYPRLIYQHLHTACPILDSNRQAMPTAFLSGMVTRFTPYSIKGSYAHTGVSFFPHAIGPLFGMDAFDITDHLPDLINFCSATLVDQLADTDSQQQRVELLTQFLIKRLKIPYHEDSLIKDFLFKTQRAPEWNVDTLRKDYKLSMRQLERKFKSCLGASPKLFYRIERFEGALGSLKAGKYKRLSDIAFNFEYADQSHFVREFKEFTGLAPKQFLSQPKLIEESNSFLAKAKGE